MLTSKDYKRATQAAREADVSEPRALGVSYDQATRRLVLDLTNGVTLLLPVDKIQGLNGAGDRDLAKIELFANGEHLNWDRLDVQFTVPQLVAGVFGTKIWMRELMSKAGQAKTPAKRAASRANGAKGGRPRKTLA